MDVCRNVLFYTITINQKKIKKNTPYEIFGCGASGQWNISDDEIFEIEVEQVKPQGSLGGERVRNLGRLTLSRVGTPASQGCEPSARVAGEMPASSGSWAQVIIEWYRRETTTSNHGSVRPLFVRGILNQLFWQRA